MQVHKKGDNQCMKNHRLIFLLLVLSKIFERLIFNAMFKHFLNNNLNSSNQSGFKRSDSWINQLIAVTHDIFKGFNDGLEVKGVFLAISKSLDKV